MKKEKTYIGTRFSSAAIAEAHRSFESIHLQPSVDVTEVFSVRTRTVTWEYDDIEEFLAALPNNEVAEYYRNHTGIGLLHVAIHGDHSTVTVALGRRPDIEKMFNIFERHAPNCVVPEGQRKRDGRAFESL